MFLGNFADRGSAANYGLAKPKANQLFLQVAGGKFELFPCPAVEVPMRCSGAVFADLDNDGDLDLYVTSNRQAKPFGEDWQRVVRGAGCRLYRNDGCGRFVDVSETSGACPADFFRCRDIGVFDVDGDGLLDLFVMQDKGIGPDDVVTGLKLFRNRGRFQFEDVVGQVGLPTDLWGAGIAVADLNGDRRPDFYVCGGNRLFLSQAVGRPSQADTASGNKSRHGKADLRVTYHEPEAQRATFNQPEGELDWVTGAAFGDLDRDGDLDLITGRHHYHGQSRVHVYLNDGLRDGEPRFREITRELGLPPLPQKAPHPEIQDFDNDGLLDLYWSVDVVDGTTRRPFICRGLGVSDGLPRFAVPSVPEFSDEVLKQNVPPPDRAAMIYHVNGPALDYDGDGDLDILGGNWPPGGSHVLRNDTPAGHWLQVRVVGRCMNRQGIGAQVRAFTIPREGVPRRLLGFQEITLNGGYSSSRPAQVHFGLGEITECELEVTFPTCAEPCLRRLRTNQTICITEP
ncbi:MAG: CRTAC1 family protein [Planctomycetaceae bacterium]|nr:CRTAC1 family protein [Planctomycetaceae bacterium]